MKRFAAVVWREWAAQRNVALIACVLAAAPWLLGLYPSVAANERAEVVAVAAETLSGGFVVIFSILLGATMVASDIAERRLSFYLPSPLTASQLWIGKLLADAALLTAGGVLVTTPALSPLPCSA